MGDGEVLIAVPHRGWLAAGACLRDRNRSERGSKCLATMDLPNTITRLTINHSNNLPLSRATAKASDTETRRHSDKT